MRKTVATFVAICFLFSSVAAPLVEANFWGERRRSVESRNGTQLASLPAGFQGLDQALPSATAARISPVSHNQIFQDNSPRASQIRRLPALASLSSAHGEIRQVYLAPQAEKRPLVIHLQDAHGILEAQQNLAAITADLVNTGSVPLVGLEGAAGDYNLVPYWNEPNQTAVKLAAQFLMLENVMGGPEYAGWTSAKKPQLFGIEDVDLYLRNLNAFKQGTLLQKDMRTTLAGFRASLEPLKALAFTPALKGFDQKETAYHEGKLELTGYIRYLAIHPGMKAAIAARFPNVKSLLALLDMETSMNFAQVEEERRRLIESLGAKLTPAQIEALVQSSLAYRAGHLSYGAYYDGLRKMCASAGVDLRQYPGMEKYIAYVLLSEKLVAEKLLAEISGLETAARAPLLKTAEQKELQKLGSELVLLGKLMEFQLTPEDWVVYGKQKETIAGWPARLAKLGGGAVAASIQGKAWSESLAPFELFCDTALRRNDAFVAKLLARMEKGNHKAAVLVAGGFHSEGLAEILRKKGVSYAIVTPKIDVIPEDSAGYLDFLREGTPLDRLFAGEKITAIWPRVAGVKAVPGYDSSMAMRVVEGFRQAMGETAGGLHKGTDGMTYAVVKIGPNDDPLESLKGSGLPYQGNLSTVKAVELEGQRYVVAVVQPKGAGPGPFGPVRNYLNLPQLGIGLLATAGIAFAFFGGSSTAVLAFVGMGALAIGIHEIMGHLGVFTAVGGKTFKLGWNFVETEGLSHRHAAWVAIAGPLANIFFTAIGFALVAVVGDPIVAEWFKVFAYANLAFGLASLLPIGKASDMENFLVNYNASRTAKQIVAEAASGSRLDYMAGVLMGQQKPALDRVIDITRGGEEVPNARDIQIMALQGLSILALKEQGVPAAEHLQLTTDRTLMVAAGDKDRGPSYLAVAKGADGKPVIAVAKNEGEPGLYWRGFETSASKHDHAPGPHWVHYIMVHGAASPRAVANVTPDHLTYFAPPVLPDGRINSTGAGHEQKNALDIKQVQSGIFVQFGHDQDGNPTAMFAGPGDFLIARPNTVDAMVFLGHAPSISARDLAIGEDGVIVLRAQRTRPVSFSNGTGYFQDISLQNLTADQVEKLGPSQQQSPRIRAVKAQNGTRILDGPAPAVLQAPRPEQLGEVGRLGVVKGREKLSPARIERIVRNLQEAEIEAYLEDPRPVRLVPHHQRVTSYTWGGTQIKPHIGETNDAPDIAESWAGAHPDGMSGIEVAPGVVVDAAAVLALDSDNALVGAEIWSSFRQMFPFLYKFLDTRMSLSGQVHPNLQQAIEGRQREQREIAAGRMDPALAVYVDPNHKPEVLYANTRFISLYGFRPAAQITAVFSQYFSHTSFAEDFIKRDTPSLKAIFTRVLEAGEKKSADGKADKSELNGLLAPALNRLVTAVQEGAIFTDSQNEYWVLQDAIDFGILKRKSGAKLSVTAIATANDIEVVADKMDPGLFLDLILNVHVIQPGQILFQEAGVPHFYKLGFGFELMANSNNVARLGLTPKAKNIPELLRIMDGNENSYRMSSPPLSQPTVVRGNESYYEFPGVTDFAMSVIDLADGAAYTPPANHEVEILTVDGTNDTRVTVTDASGRPEIYKRGEFIFVPRGVAYTIQSKGHATLIKATVPSDVYKTDAAPVRKREGFSATPAQMVNRVINGQISQVTDDLNALAEQDQAAAARQLAQLAGELNRHFLANHAGTPAGERVRQFMQAMMNLGATDELRGLADQALTLHHLAFNEIKGAGNKDLLEAAQKRWRAVELTAEAGEMEVRDGVERTYMKKGTIPADVLANEKAFPALRRRGQPTLGEAALFSTPRLRHGTSGIRGKDRNLTDLDMHALTRAVVLYFKNPSQYRNDLPSSATFMRGLQGEEGSPEAFVLGGDLRAGTNRMLRASANAIADLVETIYDAGRVPTPAVFNAAKNRGLASAIYTGSHIPLDENGEKSYTAAGETLRPDYDAIEALAEKTKQEELNRTLADSMFDDYLNLKPEYQNRTEVQPIDGGREYQDRYATVYQGSLAVDGQPTEVAIWQQAVVGRDLYAPMFKNAGARAHNFGRRDDLIAVDTEAMKENQLALIKEEYLKWRDAVNNGKNTQYIASTDGDGDRPVLIQVMPDPSAQGGITLRFIKGDVVVAMTAVDLKNRTNAKKPHISMPVSTNPGVVEYLKRNDFTVALTEIGSVQVIGGINGALAAGGYDLIVGGEVNGGFLLGMDVTLNGKVLTELSTRDAFPGMVSPIGLAAREGKTVAEYVDTIVTPWADAADFIDYLAGKDQHEIIAKMKAVLLPEIGGRPVPDVAWVVYEEGQVTLKDQNDAVIQTWRADGKPEEAAAYERMLDARAVVEETLHAIGYTGDISKINVKDGMQAYFLVLVEVGKMGTEIGHLRPSANGKQMRLYAFVSPEVPNAQTRANRLRQNAVEGKNESHLGQFVTRIATVPEGSHDPRPLLSGPRATSQSRSAVSAATGIGTAIQSQAPPPTQGAAPATDSPENRKENLAALRGLAAANQGPRDVIAIVNGGDGAHVEGVLSGISRELFRGDGSTTVMSFEEEPSRGQFFGLLAAIREWKKRQGRDLDRNHVAAGIMMPGKGTRMSPLTQWAFGIKPFIPMLIRTVRGSAWLSAAAASIFSWTLVTSRLEALGFRGIAWKWGDEPQIASRLMGSFTEDLSKTDAIRVGQATPMPEDVALQLAKARRNANGEFDDSVLANLDDLAQNKEWLVVDRKTNRILYDIRRRPLERLIALRDRLQAEHPDMEIELLTHMGSPAFSYALIDAAEAVYAEEIGDTTQKMDVDGFVFAALTMEKEFWDADIEDGIIVFDKKDAAKNKAQADAYYGKIQELKKHVNRARGRDMEADLEIRVLNMGQRPYWGDIGQLAKARQAIWVVNDRVSPDGAFARQLALIDGVTPDQFGNIVVGSSAYPQDGTVQNSVIIDSVIHSAGKVDGAVFVNSQVQNVSAKQGSVVFDSTVRTLEMGKDAYAHGAIGETIVTPDFYVHTTLPEDPADIAGGAEQWQADGRVNVGSDSNYNNPISDNPRSFAEEATLMRKRNFNLMEAQGNIASYREQLADSFETPPVGKPFSVREVYVKFFLSLAAGVGVGGLVILGLAPVLALLVIAPSVAFYGFLATAVMGFMRGGQWLRGPLSNARHLGSVSDVAAQLAAFGLAPVVANGEIRVNIGGKPVVVQVRRYENSSSRVAPDRLGNTSGAVVTVEPGLPSYLLPFVIYTEIHRVSRWEALRVIGRSFPFFGRSKAVASAPTSLEIPRNMGKANSTVLFELVPTTRVASKKFNRYAAVAGRPVKQPVLVPSFLQRVESTPGRAPARDFSGLTADILFSLMVFYTPAEMESLRQWGKANPGAALRLYTDTALKLARYHGDGRPAKIDGDPWKQHAETAALAVLAEQLGQSPEVRASVLDLYGREAAVQSIAAQNTEDAIFPSGDGFEIVTVPVEMIDNRVQWDPATGSLAKLRALAELASRTNENALKRLVVIPKGDDVSREDLKAFLEAENLHNVQRMRILGAEAGIRSDDGRVTYLALVKKLEDGQAGALKSKSIHILTTYDNLFDFTGVPDAYREHVVMYILNMMGYLIKKGGDIENDIRALAHAYIQA